jgi:hypothetical protein
VNRDERVSMNMFLGWLAFVLAVVLCGVVLWLALS